MSMTDLVAAGAPELPEGYFYRVGSAHFCDLHRVQIRRARAIGSVMVAWTIENPSRHYASALDSVVASCRYVYRGWREREESRLDASALYGDHDPKGGR